MADRAVPHVRTLYAGPVVSLAERRCPGHDASVAGDECSDAYEVVVARRGVFARHVAGDRVIIDAGTAAFWHPGDVYQVTHPVPGGDCCSIFRLPLAGVRDLLAAVDAAAADAGTPRFPVSHVPLAGGPYLLHRMAIAAAHAALNDAASGGVTQLRIEESAIAFARATVAAAQEDRAARGKAGRTDSAASNRHAREYTARVREFVAARYRQPLTLQDIARAVGCSPYHLSRLVSATAGLPIYRLVIRLRLRDALERVIGTRDDISAIAFDVGFASHSHLAEAFRREFGVTPSAVRSRDARPAPGRHRAGRRAGSDRSARFR